eukprot:8532629-Ditylum_brightwellii.AAC.1
MPAGMGSGDEDLTMDEYQKSFEMFLPAAYGGMLPPPPKPPLNKKCNQLCPSPTVRPSPPCPPTETHLIQFQRDIPDIFSGECYYIQDSLSLVI